MEQTVAITERVKDWYERISGFPFHPITAYIRQAGYYTKTHLFNMDFLGTYKGFRIIGSKNRKILRHKFDDGDELPEILISVEKINFMASQVDLIIICPPDPKLDHLEEIAMNIIQETFSEQKVQEEK